jgi:folylpolyglutamate synthase/dihydropteroate synthase
MVFGISKNKKLDDIINYLENDEAVRELYVVSRPHMRLHRAEDAHNVIKSLDSKKLKDLIPAETSEKMLTKSDDSATEQVEETSAVSNVNNTWKSNVAQTLDYILKEQKLGPTDLLLICGSFFIMSDVKEYFGYEQVVDIIQCEIENLH